VPETQIIIAGNACLTFSCLCRLRVFSDAVKRAATASGRDSIESLIAASATIAAYATAFASELGCMEQKVIQLQDHFKARSCMSASEASDVNLATLEAALQVGMLINRVTACSQ